MFRYYIPIQCLQVHLDPSLHPTMDSFCQTTIPASACWPPMYQVQHSLTINAEQAHTTEETAFSDLYNQPAKPTQTSANHKHHQVLILCFSRHTWRKKIITHVRRTGTF